VNGAVECKESWLRARAALGAVDARGEVLMLGKGALGSMLAALDARFGPVVSVVRKSTLCVKG